VGICIAVVVLVLALIVIFLLLRMWRKRTQHESRHDYFEDELSGKAMPSSFHMTWFEVKAFMTMRA